MMKIGEIYCKIHSNKLNFVTFSLFKMEKHLMICVMPQYLRAYV